MAFEREPVRDHQDVNGPCCGWLRKIEIRICPFACHKRDRFHHRAHNTVRICIGDVRNSHEYWVVAETCKVAEHGIVRRRPRGRTDEVEIRENSARIMVGDKLHPIVLERTVQDPLFAVGARRLKHQAGCQLTPSTALPELVESTRPANPLIAPSRRHRARQVRYQRAVQFRAHLSVARAPASYRKILEAGRVGAARPARASQQHSSHNFR